MQNIIIEEANDLNASLSKYLLPDSKRIHEFELNCSELSEKFLKEDIRDSVEFRDMFKKLSDIETCPCLYVFELKTEISAEEIVNNIKCYGDAESTTKILPKIKTDYSRESKILYVGKVNNLIWGRLITHLGFHTNKNGGNPIASNNHGLQLFQWAKDLSLILKFTVIEFDSDMKDLVSVLEKRLAKRINPIIGKHL